MVHCDPIMLCALELYSSTLSHAGDVLKILKNENITTLITFLLLKPIKFDLAFSNLLCHQTLPPNLPKVGNLRRSVRYTLTLY
jgi:hypothetical protein